MDYCHRYICLIRIVLLYAMQGRYIWHFVNERGLLNSNVISKQLVLFNEITTVVLIFHYPWTRPLSYSKCHAEAVANWAIQRFAIRFDLGYSIGPIVKEHYLSLTIWKNIKLEMYTVFWMIRLVPGTIRMFRARVTLQQIDDRSLIKGCV